MQYYYILSLKWTTGDLCVWFRPEQSGYTRYLNEAGRYSEYTVKAILPYYGVHASAIPCEVVERATQTVVPNESAIRAEFKASAFPQTTVNGKQPREDKPQ